MQKKFEKLFFVVEIMAVERVGNFSSSNDENTCDLHSTCYQTFLKFQISLTQIFSNSMCVESVESSNKRAAMVVSVVFNTREHIDSRRLF